jgi:PEGA domain
MKRLVPRLMVVAMFAASASLAEAQAVARGGGSSSSSSGSSGSSSSGGGGGGGGSTTSSSSGGGSSYTPPSPPVHSAPPRTPSHSGGGYTSGSRGDGSSSSSGGSRGTAAIRHPENGSTTTATPPTYARPDGVVGYAIHRRPGAVNPPPVFNPPIYVYDPWYWGGWGYGLGLGYFYDPWYRYGYGYGWPGGYGYYGGGYDYWDGGNYSTYDSTYDSRSQDEALSGQLRIKVKPREARVIVDGNFMGTVDDFDGMFQKLALPEGRHQVQLQLDGYETLTFNVMIIAGQTVNYEGHMQKVGEAPRR